MWKGQDDTLSTSKYILKVLVRLFTIIIAYTFWITYRTGDQQTLAIIAGGIIGLLTTAVGFYYWKAKNEKMIEYRMLEKELKVDSEVRVDEVSSDDWS